MHDRRIDGETILFGNAGGLYMRAMTWWDHKTQSIWSQPWGQAIGGPLQNTTLELLPSQVTTWTNWYQNHPETQVMINDTDRFTIFRQGFSRDFVIGVVLGDHAKAFPFSVLEQGVLNDRLGEYPILVWAGEDDFRVYLRQVGDQVLTFRLDGDVLVDEETRTVWDVRLGLAVEGDLAGQAMQTVPSLTSYDWAWIDFYPEGEIYQPLP